MSKRLHTAAVGFVVTALVASAAYAVAGCGKTEPTSIRVGTLQTEEALPLYVAAQKNFYKEENLKVTTVAFPSAVERDAALKAGKIDAAVADLLSAAALKDKGVNLSVVGLTVGATPQEGRYAIVVPKRSTIKKVAQLKKVSIAVAKGETTEYVTHELLKENGFKDNQIRLVDVQQKAFREELVASNLIKAATFSDPSVALVEKRGARVLVADTRGPNLSQTAIVFRGDFADNNGAAVTSFLKAEANAAKAINANPATFRTLLVQKARIPTRIAATYPMTTYATSQGPQKEEVDRLLGWMKGKKLVKGDVTFENLVNTGFQP